MLTLGQKLIPIVGWVAAIQHLAEHPVSIAVALIGAFGVGVVDPSKHDHFAGRVVTEK